MMADLLSRKALVTPPTRNSDCLTDASMLVEVFSGVFLQVTVWFQYSITTHTNDHHNTNLPRWRRCFNNPAYLPFTTRSCCTQSSLHGGVASTVQRVGGGG